MSFTIFDMTALTDFPSVWKSTYGVKTMKCDYTAPPGTNTNYAAGVVEALATSYLSTPYVLMDIEGLWTLGMPSDGYSGAGNNAAIACYKNFLQRWKGVNTFTKVGFWDFPTRDGMYPWASASRVSELRTLVATIKAGLAPYKPDFTTTQSYWDDDDPEGNDLSFRTMYLESRRIYPELPCYTAYWHRSAGNLVHGLTLNAMTIRFMLSHIKRWGDGMMVWESGAFNGVSKLNGSNTIVVNGTTVIGAGPVNQGLYGAVSFDGNNYTIPQNDYSSNLILRDLVANSWVSHEYEHQPWILLRNFILAQQDASYKDTRITPITNYSYFT